MIPLSLAVVAFTFSNRGPVSINFWPLPVAYELPVFIVVMAGMLAGFLGGAVVAWTSASRTRQRNRALMRQLENAKREEAYLKERIRKLETSMKEMEATTGPEPLALPKVDAA